MNRLDPPPSREAADAMMRSWLASNDGLERIRRALPEGATLDDALAFHRRQKQLRRQPSACMREPDDGDGDPQTP